MPTLVAFHSSALPSEGTVVDEPVCKRGAFIMRRSESTLIKDDESPEKKRAHHVAKELTAADEFMAFADDIESRRDAAKAQNDVRMGPREQTNLHPGPRQRCR